MALFDVLGLGAVSVDDIIYVEAYPPPDRKTRVLRRERHFGGNTATALVAAARLGMRCSYAGVLGEDDLSHAAIQNLAQAEINLEYLSRRPGVRPIYAIIITDLNSHTRNIFFDVSNVLGAADDWPPEEIVQSCRVLMVDHIRFPGMIRSANIARQAGIPVVADLEREDPRFAELLDLSDHLIISWEFSRQLTGADTPALAAARLMTRNRSLVAITCGAEGCWYLSDANPIQALFQPAFQVSVVDTTGCGDIFHGAYAAGLVKGLSASERIRYASAAAALKAMVHGGQSGAPTASQIDAFLTENK